MDTKREGGNTNHICIAPPTKLKNGVINAQLYVHSWWVCA